MQRADAAYFFEAAFEDRAEPFPYRLIAPTWRARNTSWRTSTAFRRS